jgi:hypothetical protein
MTRKIGTPQLLVLVAVVAGVALVAALLGFAEDEKVEGRPAIVCIDSTVSTNGVRSSYLPDLSRVAQGAAEHQANFYAAPCGANATGSVDWPVRRKFKSNYSNAEQAAEQAKHQAKEVIDGAKGREGLRDLLKVRSKLEGTPLGEMLAVLARQCAQVGGECSIYLFTDGEWADKGLKVGDGIDSTERSQYLDAYISKLTGLAGSTVNFVGVGYGTTIGEVHLAEARQLAGLLVKEAGGTMGAWTTRL